MRKIRIWITLLFVTTMASTWASSSLQNIQKFNWNGLEVVYLEENRFPTYSVEIYFADGALSDQKGLQGETEMMFDLLTSGTNRHTQQQINESLEIFGVRFSTHTTHEYSTVQVSGLVKDLAPTFKLVCDLFNDAIFPDKEIENHQKQLIQQLLNIKSSPGALANQALRRVTFKGTPYEIDTMGTLKTIPSVKSSHLKEKRSYFRDQVSKRVYITGPKEVLNLQSILVDECHFRADKTHFTRTLSSTPAQFPQQGGIYLIPLEESNQAEIRMGRSLNSDEIKDRELLSVVSGYLGSGGGITFKLMQELRLKRGLTYGAQAVISPQKEYGRAVVATSTKIASVTEVLDVISSILKEGSEGKFTDTELSNAKNFMAGHFPFSIEKGEAYLDQLMMFDHVGKPYSDLYPEIFHRYNREQFQTSFNMIFGKPEAISTIIVGPRTLEGELKKRGPVTILDYKELL